MTIEFNDRTVDFDARYRVIEDDVMQRIERRVIGSGYGANSYTTASQADELAKLLDVGPESLLLDIGSGAGWPGVYLARATGCRVVLTDMTIEGLRVAAGRLQGEGVNGAALGASGTALPIRNESFDAATCSDVFC
jgi:cyclopropane fatty-acyl-phospholipid synthase-like methyltransferase